MKPDRTKKTNIWKAPSNSRPGTGKKNVVGIPLSEFLTDFNKIPKKGIKLITDKLRQKKIITQHQIDHIT